MPLLFDIKDYNLKQRNKEEVMSNNGLLREQLIQALSSEDIATLAQEIEKNFGLCASRVRGEGLRAVKAKQLFSFLHLKIFGNWSDGEGCAIRVMGSMDKVKEFIHGLSPAQVFKVKEEYPQMPQNLSISNKSAGTVAVRPRAWIKFIESRHRRLAHNPSEMIAMALQDSFAEAIPVKLAKSYCVARIINNDFHQAEYYLNGRMQLRFVVSMENGLKTLFTVERPY